MKILLTMRFIICVFLVVILICLCKTKIVSGNVLYEEDFEDGIANGITIESGSYIISSGLNSTHGFKQPSCCNAVISLDKVQSDNVSISIDFLISGSNHGDFDTYLNVLSLNRYEITNSPGGSDTPLAVIMERPEGIELDSRLNTINAGEIHSLKINRYGSNIDVYLDDNLYMQTSNANHHGGLIKFRSWDAVTIDNIKVTSLPEPTTSVLFFIGLLLLWTNRKIC